jgi:tripartite-type tricarboxylate transporter receptor subunit TctC
MKRLLAALALGIIAAAPARAETYPSRPVRVLVPYAPGGATDIVARLVAERLRETLGQTFIVENKPGAFGLVTVEEVARAQPDGYTLMVGNVSTNAITPLIYKDKMKTDYEKSVVPVARLAVIPAVIAASTTSAIKINSLAELVAYGRKNPGKLNYTSAGVGSYPHYDAAMLAKKAGFESVHIPAKTGAAGMISDLITGDVHFGFVNVASSLPMIRSGQLVPLGVITAKRMAELPDVPTLTELGYQGIGTFNWQGLYAPAGTPQAVLDTLHKAVVDALATPSIKSAFEKSLIAAEPSASPGDAASWMQGEMGLWRKTAAESGVVLE